MTGFLVRQSYGNLCSTSTSRRSVPRSVRMSITSPVASPRTSLPTSLSLTWGSTIPATASLILPNPSTAQTTSAGGVNGSKADWYARHASKSSTP